MKRIVIGIIGMVIVVIVAITAYIIFYGNPFGFSGNYICTKGNGSFQTGATLEFKPNGEVYITTPFGMTGTNMTIAAKYEISGNRITIKIETLGTYILKGEIKDDKIIMDDGTVLEKRR